MRGLSTRDLEATLADALGPEAALSKSTVSRVCERRSRTSSTRGSRAALSAVEPEYLYRDASHFRLQDGAAAAPPLVLKQPGRYVFACTIPTGGVPLAELLSRLPRSCTISVSAVRKSDERAS